MRRASSWVPPASWASTTGMVSPELSPAVMYRPGLLLDSMETYSSTLLSALPGLISHSFSVPVWKKSTRMSLLPRAVRLAVLQSVMG